MNRSLLNSLLGVWIFSFVFGANHLLAQYAQPAINPSNATSVTTSLPKAQITYLEKAGEISRDTEFPNWMRTFKNLEVDHEGPNQEIIEKIKKHKTALKKQMILNGIAESSKFNDNGRVENPSVGRNFLGNRMDNGTPPDNTMAISNAGIIVSSDNNSIEYYDVNGSKLFSKVHSDFLFSLGLSNDFFDPRVIYDSAEDHFIFVILHGSTASSSKVIITFSKTNDPMDGWYFYQATGNPLNDNSWWDYPNIAVSEHDLYVTGNLFNPGTGAFKQAYMYQMNKFSGYLGNTLSTLEWPNMKDGNNETPFTLVPLAHGHQGNYGPGIYMVSNDNRGANQIQFYEVTDQLANSPQINAFNILTTPYELAGEAFMQGSNDTLLNGDNRIQSGFYLDGFVHFVFPAEYGNTTWNGIVYKRINVGNLLMTTTSFGKSGTDYSFPCVASFSDNTEDHSVMISSLSSNPNIYPQVIAINCDHNMVWSDPKLIKVGTGYINLTFDGRERWGDYSTIVRKQNEARPKTWMVGCFGTSQNGYDAWIAEIVGAGTAPVADFTMDKNHGDSPVTISFADNSTNNPNILDWNFGDGNIGSGSNVSNTYFFSGSFPITLTAQNNYGSSTFTAYVHVDVPTGVEIAPSEKDLGVFPMPINSMFQVDFTLEERTPIDITILNVGGQTVKLLYSGTAKRGKNRLSFNKNALADGTYILVISSGENPIMHEKIIVAH